MKKAFVLLTVLFCLVMVCFSIYYKKTENVLVVAEIVEFEIEDIQKIENNINNDNIINTSLNQIGIITYINPETNQFAALGHSLIDGEYGTDINGLCYNVEFEQTGENLVRNIETISNKENAIGYVYYDNNFGIYGKVNEVQDKKYQEVQTANRYDIKKGKANILIRLDGENLESYEVEIIGINYIANNKNIRVKITDERLINETGGIVQGMSGTPVMQNGKMVGAINCVNIKDSKDAYAIFIDKII